MDNSDFKDAEVKRMKLSELSPAEYNPRKITTKAFKGLKASINKFGLLVPIVWNKRTGNIVGGHQRFKYLTEMGEIETDVIVVDIDEQEEVALNITLNNKELRGQFTEDAIGLLKITEAQIGSVFGEMALVELHDALVKQLKPKPKDKDKTSATGSDFEGNDGSTPDSDEPVAVITCPECKSRWRMSDDKVIFDGTKEKKDD